MTYSRLISEVDECYFNHELYQTINDETQKGSELIDIHFSTCPAALSPFTDAEKADLYSVTRYSAILLFNHQEYAHETETLF